MRKRSPKIAENYEVRRLNVEVNRLNNHLGIVRAAIGSAVQAYQEGRLGHQEIGELVASLQGNAGWQATALMSRLMLLFRVCVTHYQKVQEGDEDMIKTTQEKVFEAIAEVNEALQEEFYE